MASTLSNIDRGRLAYRAMRGDNEAKQKLREDRALKDHVAQQLADRQREVGEA